ncbi:MAG: protease complex subunit PrcB family protein [Bacillota bacterium]
MKHFTLLLVITALLAMFSGCNTSDVNPDMTPTPTPGQNTNSPSTPPQGITVNDISFKLLDYKSLSSEKLKTIEALKENRGYIYWEEDNAYIIAIFSGMQGSAGHDIIVRSIQDNEGKTVITVEEKAPSDSAATVITHPLTVVRAAGITNNFVITNTNGVSFEALMEQQIPDAQTIKASGIYTGRVDTNSIEVKLDNGDIKVFVITDIIHEIDSLTEGSRIQFLYYTNAYGQNIIARILK